MLPDERSEIERELARFADADAADLVLTTGGTGLSPRDVTPQATLAVGDYEVPGLGEAMRAATRAAFPAASLSRQTAVVRGRTLIVNLPGSPSGAVECLEAVASLLPHAVATLRGARRRPSDPRRAGLAGEIVESLPEPREAFPELVRRDREGDAEGARILEELPRHDRRVVGLPEESA